MPTEVPVHTAADGKTEHMELWALVNAETNAELRRIALSLWLDMRERQEEAGFTPSAAVWLAGKRLKPTKAEIEEHKAQPLKKLSSMRGTSETRSDGDDSSPDSSPALPVVEEKKKPPHKPPSLEDLMYDDLDFD